MRRDPPKRLRVVALPGSLRDPSYTRAALRIALDGAAEVGAETQMLDLREYDLIFCDGSRKDEEVPPDVLRLRNDVRAAHGVILGTPEYHGTMSGVLKNALDLMGWREFEGKMVGLVGVAGGSIGATNSLNDLRTVGRVLHAWVVPEQASIPRASDAFGPDGDLKDPKLQERVLEVGRQVGRFARLHNARQSLEFIEQWEQATENPGG